MARIVNSYTINGTNKIVKPGDCVLIKPAEPVRFPYIARVEKLKVDRYNKVRVMVQYYYRPEDTKEGRKRFHGYNELYLSDHYDWQSARTIYAKCKVHSFDEYVNLNKVTIQDYFSRFEYKAAAKEFACDYEVPVYCKCEMPYNPDQFMIQCDGCDNWFHPSCVAMTIKEADKLARFFCLKCRGCSNVTVED